MREIMLQQAMELNYRMRHDLTVINEFRNEQCVVIIR